MTRNQDSRCKQEDEERKLAEQYGMPYEEKDNKEENSIK